MLFAVLHQPVTPHHRSCLRTLESCIKTSCHRTVNWSSFNARRSSTFFLKTCQPLNLSMQTKHMVYSMPLRLNQQLPVSCLDAHTTRKILRVCQHPILAVEICSIKCSLVSMVSHEVQFSCRTVDNSSILSDRPSQPHSTG